MSHLAGRGRIFGLAGEGNRAADEGGYVGLWGTREHLSVNGFCNWESVKLPNRLVHLLTLLNELDQPSHIAIFSTFFHLFMIIPGFYAIFQSHRFVNSGPISS